MFHVSFLVKEGKVSIFVDDDGLPKIEVIRASRRDHQPSNPKRQVSKTIFS